MTNITLEQAVNISEMIGGDDKDFNLAIDTMNNLKISDLTKHLLFLLATANAKDVRIKHNITRRKSFAKLYYKYQHKSIAKTHDLVLNEYTELNKKLFEMLIEKMVSTIFNLDISLALNWKK